MTAGRVEPLRPWPRTEPKPRLGPYQIHRGAPGWAGGLLVVTLLVLIGMTLAIIDDQIHRPKLTAPANGARFMTLANGDTLLIYTLKVNGLGMRPGDVIRVDVSSTPGVRR